MEFIDDESREPRIRVLAYVDRVFGPRKRAKESEAQDEPSAFLGFFLDVTVEVHSGRRNHVPLLQHYGDGILYQTLEEALEVVVRESGIDLILVPQEKWRESPKTGSAWDCVACFVAEFIQTDTPIDHVQADSPLPRRNADLTRRLTSERRLVAMPNSST